MTPTDCPQRDAVGQHGRVTEEKRPVDQALDALVYAPLGFALEARQLLPTFVERGRAQIEMARVIGRFAVRQGQVEAEKRLSAVQGRAGSLLAEFGMGSDTVSHPADDASTSVEPDAPVPAAVVDEPAPPAPRTDALPIAGYDSLAASQVIPRLAGLDADELDIVRRYETANRGRKTILGRIDQLQQD